MLNRSTTQLTAAVAREPFYAFWHFTVSKNVKMAGTEPIAELPPLPNALP